MTQAAVPLLAHGVVRHRRLRPAQHAFQAPVCFVLLPMRALRQDPGALVRNRFGWLAFHDRDHGEGGPDALAWIESLLHRAGVADAGGEIWLQTFPRVLGHAFKPVSFWYCHRADDSLAAVVAEVNNTFGERHCYLLSGTDTAWGREMTAAKVFHVSPFCAVQGRYRFRFLRTERRIVAHIDHDDDQGPLLRTSQAGTLVPLTAATARRAAWRMPWAGLAVVARIHWHALRLWLKRVPWFSKPAPPPHEVSAG